MSFRPFRSAVLPPLFALSILVGTSACATHRDQQENNRPGLFRRTLQFFHLASREENNNHGENGRAPENPTVRVKDLTLQLQLSPQPLRLSETRQLKVTLTASNRSRRFVHLEFPTTQRIEILVRENASDKLVVKWSEDQAFSNQPAFVTINPGERIEYNANVPTRDFVAGRDYTIEVFFPDFDQLRIAQKFSAEK